MNRNQLFRTARHGLRERLKSGASGPLRSIGAGILVLGLGLSAAAKDEPHVGAAFTPPETPAGVPGTDARPATRARSWHQIGVASWYGRPFHGRLTANGEHYNMYGMTCAHPSLPLGTWLRVTNLRNRRTAFVRVNDRGPVFRGRIVDLSYAAARMLHIQGIARVRLDAIRSGDRELAQALVNEQSMPLLFALVN